MLFENDMISFGLKKFSKLICPEIPAQFWVKNMTTR